MQPNMWFEYEYYLLSHSQGHRLHQGSRLFGRCWHAGDVVGCMINMEDKSMIFTLNGEILITNKGSELCFADFETEDGERQFLIPSSCFVTRLVDSF